MRNAPSLPSTQIISECEWRPADFNSFMTELDGICDAGRQSNHYLLYRGHRDYRWFLDSTFVRFVKENIFGIPGSLRQRKQYRYSYEYLYLLTHLFLYKFGTHTRPSRQLRNIVTKIPELDSWFEFMKHIQQYAETDIGPMKGSFLIDWTQTPEIAIYFANENNKDHDIEGAIWIFDATATGSVLHQDMKVFEIMNLVQESVQNFKAPGLPLIFCPRKQIQCERSKNQDAIYVAQMDLRFDLFEHWEYFRKINHIQELVALKLILPRGSQKACEDLLLSKGINTKYVYPDLNRIKY